MLRGPGCVEVRPERDAGAGTRSARSRALGGRRNGSPRTGSTGPTQLDARRTNTCEENRRRWTANPGRRSTAAPPVRFERRLDTPGRARLARDHRARRAGAPASSSPGRLEAEVGGTGQRDGAGSARSRRSIRCRMLSLEPPATSTCFDAERRRGTVRRLVLTHVIGRPQVRAPSTPPAGEVHFGSGSMRCSPARRSGADEVDGDVGRDPRALRREALGARPRGRTRRGAGGVTQAGGPDAVLEEIGGAARGR